MNEKLNHFPRFTPVGDGAILIEFNDVVTTAVNRQVRTLDICLGQTPLAGVREWIPAYCSILVLYDPQRIHPAEVEAWVKGCLAAVSEGLDRAPRQVEILVRYGGENGPDLAYVAEKSRLPLAEVIERHTRQVYQVGMMGFMPGFAYLLGLDPVLATPRLETPRVQVPAGSVGIAGDQTGIYPLASPGGWQLIGRTEQVLFTPQQEPFFLLSPGDQVRFIPVED